MSASNASLGFQTLLKYGDGATTETFTTLAEVNSLSGPKIARDTKEVTHMQSPDYYREYIGGLLDGGEVSVECNYVPDDATHGASTGSGIVSMMADGTVGSGNWEIVIQRQGTEIATWSFAAILTAFEPEYPTDDKMTFSATLKVNGKPTLALAS